MRLHLPLLSMAAGLAFGLACKPTVQQDPAPDLLAAQAGRVVEVVCLHDSVSFNPSNLLGLEEGLTLRLGTPKRGSVKFTGGVFVYTFVRGASPLGGSARLLRDTLGFTLQQDSRTVAGSFVFVPSADSANCRPLDVSADTTLLQGNTLSLNLSTLADFCPGTIFSLPFDTNRVSLTSAGHFTWTAAHAGPHPFAITVRNGDFSATLSLLVSVTALPDTTPTIDCNTFFVPVADTMRYVVRGSVRISVDDLIRNDSVCGQYSVDANSFHLLTGPPNGTLTAQDPGSGQVMPGVFFYVPTRIPVIDSLSYSLRASNGQTRTAWLYLKKP